jgi:putative ABC transport system permease protein
VTLGYLAASNLLRNKLRSLLTISGVAVAVVAFLLLRTVVWAWTVQTQDAITDRCVTRHKVTFVISLPKRYVEDMKRVPGVKQVTWCNWFGGKEPNHENEFFACIAVDHKTFLEVHDECRVPKDQVAAWMEDRQGALVGEQLAKRMGWKVGDKVKLVSQIFPGDYEYTISGIYTATRKSFDPAQFLFHWDYFNDSIPERIRDKVGWVIARIEGRAAVDVSMEIDKMFDEREDQTLTQDERTFQQSFLGMFSAILQALNIVTLVILGIMMLILGNTVAMGVRERTSEYGVLRAIGFLPRHMALLVLYEAGTLGLVGAGVGLAIAYPFVNLGLGRFIEENVGNLFPYFRVTEANAAMAVGLSIFLGTASAALPAWTAYRLHVVDALRKVI